MNISKVKNVEWQEPVVLWQDEHVVALFKPAGVLVHPDGHKHPGDTNSVKTLSDWFVEEYPEAREVGEPLRLKDGSVAERPGMIHRLDRETSGVILFAKTDVGHAHLKKQFQERTIQKTYRAFCYGKWKEEEGEIDLPIGRSTQNFRRWSAERGARGKLREATTFFKLLAATDEVSYLELYPKTGRTHQIRVHLKARQHPVVADALYAPKREALLGFDRLALHAYRIMFLGTSGKFVEVEAPLPEEFVQAEKMLQSI